jgi:hypothetical protein
MGWSATAARSHARRLEEFGWLARRPMVRGAGSLFFATRRGVDFLGLPVPPVTSAAPTWWAHDSACAWLAAMCTLRGRSFLGPRELLNSREWLGRLNWMDRNGFRRSGHRPDLIGYGRVGTVVSEVELAPKSRPRLDAILNLHQEWLMAGQSKAIDYVCGDEQGARRIETAARRAAPLVVESKALEVVLLSRVKEHVIERAESARGNSPPSPASEAK